MRFASLGSGSGGNGLVISAVCGATHTAVMLDCGFSMRETERRLARLSISPAQLRGIVVTHEHRDHIRGVFGFARQHRLPVWLTRGTWAAWQDRCEGLTVHFCRDGEQLEIGDLQLIPYAVPHDAREPVQYVVEDGIHKLGVLTDAGHVTAAMKQVLTGCDALLLECNHDQQLLANSHYPQVLKKRIAGPLGHLSNQAAAELLHAIESGRLKKVMAAHLSQHNNTPDLVRAALQQSAAEVLIACQDHGSDWQVM